MATEPNQRPIYTIALTCIEEFQGCASFCRQHSYARDKWATEFSRLIERRATSFEKFCDFMKMSKAEYIESLDYQLRNDNGTKKEAIDVLEKIQAQLKIFYDTSKDAIIEEARAYSAAVDKHQQQDDLPSYELQRGTLSDRRTLIEPKFRDLLGVIQVLYKGFEKEHAEIPMHKDYIKNEKRLQERWHSAIAKRAKSSGHEPPHAQQHHDLYICFLALCPDESKHAFSDKNAWIHHMHEYHCRRFKCFHGDKPTDHKESPVYRTIDVSVDVIGLLNLSGTNPSPVDDIGHMVLSDPSSNAAAPTGPSKKRVLVHPPDADPRCPLCGIQVVDCVYIHIIDKHFPTPLSQGFNNPSGIAQQEAALDELCTQLKHFSLNCSSGKEY